MEVKAGRVWEFEPWMQKGWELASKHYNQKKNSLHFLGGPSHSERAPHACGGGEKVFPVFMVSGSPLPNGPSQCLLVKNLKAAWLYSWNIAQTHVFWHRLAQDYSTCLLSQKNPHADLRCSSTRACPGNSSSQVVAELVFFFLRVFIVSPRIRKTSLQSPTNRKQLSSAAFRQHGIEQT